MILPRLFLNAVSDPRRFCGFWISLNCLIFGKYADFHMPVNLRQSS